MICTYVFERGIREIVPVALCIPATTKSLYIYMYIYNIYIYIYKYIYIYIIYIHIKKYKFILGEAFFRARNPACLIVYQLFAEMSNSLISFIDSIISLLQKEKFINTILQHQL